MGSEGNLNIEDLNIGSSQLPEVDGRHQPLDTTKNEIRLLNILPIRYIDGRGYGVECNLFVTSLDNSPKYQLPSTLLHLGQAIEPPRDIF
jgi:hypothetical protein